MRKPDLTIGPVDNPQTSRWHLIRWRGWQLALHKWHRSDDDRALHDHTGDNISILLTGRYHETIGTIGQFGGPPVVYKKRTVVRWPLIPYFRKAETPHRVVLLARPGRPDRPVWSLWLRWPPRRQWGFWCPKGWRHWKEYVAERGDYNEIGHSTVGKGCDE